MKTIVVVASMLISLSALGQESAKLPDGKIGAMGFFEYENYQAALQSLDYIRDMKIDGNRYFYFELINKQNGKKMKVVLDTQHEYAQDSIRSFSDLENGLVRDYDIPMLKNYIVNESKYKAVQRLSRKQFYSKYVDKRGLLIRLKDWENEKAVLYRLLQDNLVIGQNDVSGEWAIRRE